MPVIAYKYRHYNRFLKYVTLWYNNKKATPFFSHSAKKVMAS